MLKSRLKYICQSFNSSLSTENIVDSGSTKIFGASGLLGYANVPGMQCEYLGIVKDGAGIGRVNVYPKNSALIGTMAYILPNPNINIRWLKYCIESLSLGANLYSKTTIPHIYFSVYGNRDIVCPPATVQKSIANFLDHKCAEIDSLYADIEKQIEILEEYKKSIIYEAVTKGLNPDVEMKDSGIEWIGMIPKHWDVRRVKNHFSIISGSGFRNEIQGVDNEKIPVCKASDISKAGHRLYVAANSISEAQLKTEHFSLIPTNSILFAKIGEAMKKNNRTLTMLPVCADNNCQAMISINMDCEYSYYLFCCIDMSWFDNAGTIPCVNNMKLLNSKIPYPSITEQKMIAIYLEEKCAEIEAIIADKKAQLKTLAEYKKSLIYEYVTGKKEVIN